MCISGLGVSILTSASFISGIIITFWMIEWLQYKLIKKDDFDYLLYILKEYGKNGIQKKDN